MADWQRLSAAREAVDILMAMKFPNPGEWCHRSTTMSDGRILVAYLDQDTKEWLFTILPQPEA